MKYAVLFGILGAAQLCLAAVSGPTGILWAWSGLAFLAVSAAYAGLGPGVFGKRPDGRLPLWRTILLIPYLVPTWLLWRVERMLSRENPADEVAPGLWVGCRPVGGNMPAGTELVVDLTAEFSVTSAISSRCRCVTLPTLDTGAPDEAALRAVLREIENCPGPVLIHCASGHGRSAMLAAAVLLRRGLAKDVDEAEAMMRKSRPGIKLKPAQKRLLSNLPTSIRAEDIRT